MHGVNNPVLAADKGVVDLHSRFRRKHPSTRCQATCFSRSSTVVKCLLSPRLVQGCVALAVQGCAAFEGRTALYRPAEHTKQHGGAAAEVWCELHNAGLCRVGCLWC